MPIMLHDMQVPARRGVGRPRLPDVDDTQPYCYLLRNIDPVWWLEIKRLAAMEDVPVRGLIIGTLDAALQAAKRAGRLR